MALRVLVVEDEFLIAADLADLIEENQHVVVGIADSVEPAIGLIEKHQPDVATVDLRLKHGAHGADVAEYLFREHGIRSIFVSGNLDANARERLAMLEPIAFVGKPISPHILHRALDAAAREIENRPAGR